MKSFLFPCLLLIGSLSYSQKKGAAPSAPIKKQLDHTVYDGWKEINYKALTPDGSFAAFTAQVKQTGMEAQLQW